MKKYISKKYIDDLLNRYLDRWHGPEHYACTIIQDEIKNVPDSEIINMQECTVCGEEIDVSSGHFSFCPCCGNPITEVDYGRT